MTADFHTLYDWSSGATWIADGDRRVAQIQPPLLKNLVLRPGDGPSVTWLTLFWWQYAGNEQPGRSAWIVQDLRLDDQDPACYRLRISARNDERSILSMCSLALRFDEAAGSYIYEVETTLEVPDGKTWVVEPQGGVEFANPWYKDAVGSALDFLGAQKPKWQWVVYTGPHGELVRLPLNHLGSPLLERIRFPSAGGWLGFFNHSGSNPVIALDSDTAAETRAEVCAWGYDVHFIRRFPPETPWEDSLHQPQTYPAAVLAGGQRLTARYRLYGLSVEEGQALLANTQMPALPAVLASKLRRPALTLPASSFEHGIEPELPSSAWYWSPSHDEGVTWDQAFGRTGSASLHVRNDQERAASWEVPLGPDFWQAPLSQVRQRISVWIFTQQAEGAGAALGVRYSSYAMETGQQPRLPEITSRRVRGDSGWQQVDLVVDPPPPGATRAYLRLALEGPGEAWFDDLLVEPIDDIAHGSNDGIS